MERKAIELQIRASREHVRGTLRTLKENQDEAFDLLRLALNEPRFDTAAVERIRAQSIVAAAAPEHQPEFDCQPQLVGHRLPQSSLRPPGQRHARIGRPRDADDMRDYVRRVLARDTLKIGVVGDIDAETAGKLIDRTFGKLPAKAQLKPVPDAKIQGLGGRTAGRPQRPAGGGDVRRPGHRPQRSRLHGGLYRQPHPRRRLVLVAPLSRGARGARPRLRRQHRPDLVRARRGADRRHRDARRRHRRNASM